MRFSGRALGGVGMLAAFGVGWGVGCATQPDAIWSDDAGAPAPDTGVSDTGLSDTASGGDSATVSPVLCPPCVTSNDCSGGVCTQLGSDSYCAPACATGGSCATGRTCMPETSFSGQQVDVCVADDNACGVPAGPTGGGDSGTTPPPSNTCGTLVGPTVTSTCNSCSSSSSTCQANGCYGGWWCNTASSKCETAPSSCTTSGGADSGSAPPANDGGPITGTIGLNGGTESSLYFGIMGDTRPANEDDTSTYPSAIGTKIYQDLQAMNPKPPFVITTGDYMFASTSGGQAAPQMALYLQCQANYTGTVFEAMGNHECTGATASNCGSGNTDGLTDNYDTFMSQMMAPLGNSTPYYQVNVAASDNSWTAKFVFIAGNAWSSAQATWLDNALSQTTTYTFVVRHEPTEANTAPGVTPSQAIMANHPYTLAITGHTHTYEKSGTKQVVIGNGGAPLTGSGNYGYGIAQQLASGAIQFDMYDYSTNQPDTSFRFAVNPDGSAAP
jgi:hypothetical protein